MANTTKQSFVGFKVVKYDSRTVKENDLIRVVIQANVEELGGVGKSIGDFLEALQHHMSSQTEVGFSLFVNKDDSES